MAERRTRLGRHHVIGSAVGWRDFGDRDRRSNGCRRKMIHAVRVCLVGRLIAFDVAIFATGCFGLIPVATITVTTTTTTTTTWLIISFDGLLFACVEQ